MTDSRAAQVALRALVTSPGDARAAQVAARVLVETKVASRLAAQQAEVVVKGVPAERLAAQQVEVVVKVPPAERLAAQQLEVVVPVYTSTEPANTAYTTAVKADTPLGYYRLEDTLDSTRVYDSSGNNRHGVRVGGVDTFSTVDGGKAVQFTGTTGDKIEIGASNVMGTGFANMTIECWFKSGGTASGQPLISARDYGGATGNNNYEMWVNSSATGTVFVSFYCATGYTSATSPANYCDNNWHHAVGVYTGTAVILYIDGAQVATSPLTAGNVNSGGGSTLRFCNYQVNNASSQKFIDEVAIYGTALSSTRVSAHYAARIASATYAQVSRESLRVAVQSVGAARVSRESLRVAVTHRTSARLYAEHVRVLGTAPLARSSGRLYAEHVRVAHSTAALEAPAGATIKVWNGSAWESAPIKVWNGSTWADAVAAKTWNGSAWV